MYTVKVDDVRENTKPADKEFYGLTPIKEIFANLKDGSLQQLKQVRSTLDYYQKCTIKTNGRIDDYEKKAKELESKIIYPEACGNPETKLIDPGFNSFAAMFHYAYDKHYPLSISPDHFWLTVAEGLATHVNENAEQLRHNFVDFEGKVFLEVVCDGFVKGSPTNPWETVFPQFSDKISKYIGKKRDLIVSNFSTTTPIDKISSEIVLMNAMKSYFDYGCCTCCGIPRINIEGTVEDWENIRERVRALSEFDLVWWTPHVENIVNEFISTMKGNPNVSFWQRAYKLSGGSGGPFISGWLVDLFPYLTDYSRKFHKNTYLGGGGKRMFSGVKTDNFPASHVSVPFQWNYYNTIYEMEFFSGLIGLEQREDNSLRPVCGWSVQDEKKDNITDKPYTSVRDYK